MDRPLGHNDLLIAARALGLTLVTDPIRKFSRVPGLRYRRALKRVMRDNRPYTDVAMTPVEAVEFERLELFNATEAARAVAEKARRRTVKSLSKRSSL